MAVLRERSRTRSHVRRQSSDDSRKGPERSHSAHAAWRFRSGRRRVRAAGTHAPVSTQVASWTVTLIILIGSTGRSLPSVGAASIFLSTSIPEINFANTGCFEGPGVNQSR